MSNHLDFCKFGRTVKTGEELKVVKVPDVKMGFVNNDSYVLKIEKK
jgi:hypothetical protein